MRKMFLAVVLAVSLTGCASLGADTPRKKAAAVVNLTVGAPFYALSYSSGFLLNGISYVTAWIWGEPGTNEDVPLWFSSDFGPTYASTNTPWCWLYAGQEPEKRKFLLEWPAGSGVRSTMGIASLEHEWPPTFTFCRTKVGILKNRRGDETFPVGVRSPWPYNP